MSLTEVISLNKMHRFSISILFQVNARQLDARKQVFRQINVELAISLEISVPPYATLVLMQVSKIKCDYNFGILRREGLS